MEFGPIDKPYLRIEADWLLSKGRVLALHKNTVVFVGEIANLDADYIEISLD